MTLSTRRTAVPVDAVCLFSGGLDSFTGALDLLAEGDGSVSSLTTKEAKPRRLRSTCSTPRAAITARTASSSADSSSGPRPSGGQLGRCPTPGSLRPALGRCSSSPRVSPSRRDTDRTSPYTSPRTDSSASTCRSRRPRSGSLSTRTTHPHFMDALAHASPDSASPTRSSTPSVSMTKGEILAACRDPDTMRALARGTLSCAHPEAPRYAEREQGNCGYCFPCLIRRGSHAPCGPGRPRRLCVRRF